MRITGETLPVKHLSATSIALAINCAEKWRRRYILKQHDKFSGGMFLGAVDHAAIGVNLIQKIETGEDLPLEKVKLAYVEKWTEIIDLEGEPDWHDEDPSVMYQRGLKAVELYHTVVSPTIQPLAVEEKVEFEVPGLSIPVIGYLDVRTKRRVIDRKTSKNKVSAPKPDWRLQARIYSYATGLPVEFSVVTKQVTPQIVTAVEAPELLVQPADAKATERLILQVVRMLGDYLGRYGPLEPWPALGQLHPWLCSRCAAGPTYSGDCEAWIKPAIAEDTSSALATVGF